MDNCVLDRDPLVDLEGGGSTSEEDGSKEMPSSDRQSTQAPGSGWNGFFTSDELPVKGEDVAKSCNHLMNSAEVLNANVELLEKHKKKSNKKASKPPRPPKPPLLDAADQKLIKEISELAMLKKARIERMKALRKMRAAKSASSGSNMCAMVITVLFCLIIILQGAFSRSRVTINSHGSPESAVVSGGGLISVQYYRNISANSMVSPGSESPNIVEQVTGSDEERPRTTRRLLRLPNNNKRL
ncbi:hypothetical protein H6P81_014849 [Aristolochia fimbriata]|uniref:Transmembrane protein n=1 Tax=Aristolochia fimbriata TaxID=158543 RepID=A0AAV7E3W1_ARIFI|nr:hypothetical protein H6P81_014849 [Aristolochia fimbriata]